MTYYLLSFKTSRHIITMHVWFSMKTEASRPEQEFLCGHLGDAVFI